MTERSRNRPIQEAVAREISAEVFHHIVEHYPDVAEAPYWQRYKRSVGKVIRETMERLSDAAEKGCFEKELREMKSKRGRRRSGIFKRDDLRAAFARDVTPAKGESEAPFSKGEGR